MFYSGIWSKGQHAWWGGGQGIGQNRRYTEYYARLMDARIEELVMREELIMLTATELDLENNQPKDFPAPRRVYAWIRYPSHALRIQAHAIAYTKTAVKIRFFEPLIMIHRAGWVWLNSVTPAPTTDDTDDTENNDNGKDRK